MKAIHPPETEKLLWDKDTPSAIVNENSIQFVCEKDH